jgi:hypothetical protein
MASLALPDYSPQWGTSAFVSMHPCTTSTAIQEGIVFMFTLFPPTLIANRSLGYLVE